MSSSHTTSGPKTCASHKIKKTSWDGFFYIDVYIIYTICLISYYNLPTFVIKEADLPTMKKKTYLPS